MVREWIARSGTGFYPGEAARIGNDKRRSHEGFSVDTERTVEHCSVPIMPWLPRGGDGPTGSSGGAERDAGRGSARVSGQRGEQAGDGQDGHSQGDRQR